MQDCDATSPTQQWLLSPTAMANATLATVDRSNLTAYQVCIPLRYLSSFKPVLTAARYIMSQRLQGGETKVS